MTQVVLRGGAFLILTFVMVTQFTNCGTYSAATNESLSSTSVTCVASTCINETVDNLKVTANLGGGAEYSVPANLTDWNLGGDCNEGGYPYNQIVWQLYLNGVMVRNSGMTGMVSGSPSSNVNSACVNGRFLLYLNMAAITSDPVNRTGLNLGNGTRGTYDLYIEIYGLDTPASTPVRNSLTGRTHISLLAI